MKPKPKEVKVFKCPPSTALERAVGFAAASVFSLVYMIAPVYVFTSPVAVFLLGVTNFTTWLYLAPLIISAIFPSAVSPRIVGSWVVGCVPKYFNYSEVLECDDEALLEYTTTTKPCVLAVCPHGVISYGGICSGIVGASFGAPLRPKVLHNFPTAVASVVLKFPLLKHVIGIFGLIDASKKSLVRAVSKGQSIVLYPGGIAELFLSSSEEEIIVARKGFIKLALSTGADVVPIYIFGNTTVLSVFKSRMLRSLSRSLGASLTLFWGRWGLPLPKPDPLIYVRGSPLGLPKMEDPSQAAVDEWHAKYVAEVTRLFETYKTLRPDFQHKTLKVTDK